MAMSIAQPYRSRQREVGPETGGYQNPVTKPQPSPYNPVARPVYPEVPANDNWPRPANDNFTIVNNIPGAVGRQVVKRVVRNTPWGKYWDLGVFVYDTLQWVRVQDKRHVFELFGHWCVKRDCGQDPGRWPPDFWRGGPGGCESSGTVCAQQGGALQPMPVGRLTNGLLPPGVTIGKFMPFTGNIRPTVWLGRITNKWVIPFVGDMPAVTANPVVPSVNEPFFLPINQPVAQPTRSRPFGLPDRPPPTPEGSTGSYTVSEVAPRPVPVPRPRPPLEGEKEKKGAVKKALAVLLEVAFAATEGIDLIDAIYGALPAKLQKKGLTPQKKVAIIYNNMDKLDMNKMALNILTNHFTDLVIGKASALSDAHLKEYGVTVHGGGQAL